MHSTLDSKKGTSQNAKTFWGSVSEKFEESTKLFIKGDTLKSYFNKKKEKVKDFDGCYKRVQDLNPSGWSDDMCMKGALKMYAEQKGDKEFTLMHWWEALKDHPKFNDVQVEEVEKRLRLDESGAYTTSSGGNTNTESLNSLRPIGQKAAKGKGKGKASESGGLSEAAIGAYTEKAAAIRELAAAKRAKKEAEKFKAALQFLTKDTSNMTPEERSNHLAVCTSLRAQFGL